MFETNFQGVSRKIEGCSESPLRVIQGSFKVSKRSLKGVSRHFQRFKDVKESVKCVSRKFHQQAGAELSQAQSNLGKLKLYLIYA